MSIYVSSSDKFEWLWPAFFYYFDKFWPDCPFTRYLGSESREYYVKDVITLKSGNINNWGEVTIKNLSQVHSKYILFLLDDYFLQKPVNTALIRSILMFVNKIGGKYVKLTENHQTGVISLSDVSRSLYPISESDIFGTPLQAAIWNREFFLNLLRSGESPWDFERNVNDRLLGHKDIYFLKKPAFQINFGGVMHWGLIERKFFKSISRDGVDIDKKYMMTRRQQSAKILEDTMNNLSLQRIVPGFVRKFIKKFLGV